MPLRLTNAGSAAAELRSADLPRGFELRPSTMKLPPGEAPPLEVVFRPDGAGPFEGTILLSLVRASNESVSIQVRGEGTQPPRTLLVAEPPSLDFGMRTLGEPATLELQLRNDGDPGAIRIALPKVAGPYSWAASDRSPGPWVLSDRPLDLEVSFASDQPGTFAGTLDFTIEAEGEGSLVVPLLAMVAEPTPCGLDVYPSEIAFGAVSAARSHQRQLILDNRRGEDDCLVWGIGLDPGGDPAFTLPGLKETSLVVEARRSRAIEILYQPRGAAEAPERTSLILHRANEAAARLEIPVHALPVALDLFALPESIDFGIVPLGARVYLGFDVGNRGGLAAAIVGADGPPGPFGIEALDGLPLTLEPGAGASFRSYFGPQLPGIQAARYELHLEGVPEPFFIDVQGLGLDGGCPEPCPWPTAICGAEKTVLVNTPMVLAGAGHSPEGRPLRCTWSVVDAPDGSSAVPDEGCDAGFTPDLVGEYVFELMVEDDRERAGICRSTLRAEPWGGLWIEAHWSAPGDVDLHLLHDGLADPRDPLSWFREPADCYFENPIANWGEAWGSSATLDRDDVEGRGPENIRVPIPEGGHGYAIGVHAFAHGSLPVEVTTNVYCSGALVGGRQRSTLEVPGQFVLLGRVVDADGLCRFVPDGSTWLVDR